MTDTDTLRMEVVYALKFIEGVRLFVTSKQRIKKPEGDDLFDESVETIRAELLRLARENDEWQTRCLQFQTERDKARVELAALKARIAEAPIVMPLYAGNVHSDVPMTLVVTAPVASEWRGKRVRLVVEE